MVNPSEIPWSGHPSMWCSQRAPGTPSFAPVESPGPGIAPGYDRPVLFGRDREQRTLAALLERARVGTGGAIVVHGEAGVGKSSLLAAVQDSADGMRMLRTKGIESESPLAFAALHRLVLPLLDRMDRLPPPQAQALAAVLGQRPGPTGDDRFLVFLAALGLLSDAAEESPVVCVIDDAHWLDEASQAALLFIARRIDLAPIAMVFAARDGDGRRFEAFDLPSLQLAGIDTDAAEALLGSAQLQRELAPEVRAQLVSRLGGNPLALVEIASALDPAVAAGSEPLPRDLPLTRDLERVFAQQVDRLGPDVAAVLLLAALDDTGRVGLLRRAAAASGLDPDAAIAAAERAGVLTLSLTGDELGFRHPLLRSAVVRTATIADRRRAHSALADALDAVADTDRAVWHRAAAADGPDEATAARLDEAAERSQRIGGHEAASAAAERAAELSTSVGAQSARLTFAASSAWAAGDPTRTRMLIQRARAVTDTAIPNPEADRLRAFVEMNFGSPRLAHAILVEASDAAKAEGDVATARRLAMIATALATFAADSGSRVDVAALVPADTNAQDAADDCLSALLVGLDHVLGERWPLAAPELRHALELAESLQAPDLVTNLGVATLHLGDDAAALRWHDRQLDEARAAASPLGTIHALTRRGIAQITAGLWSELRGSSAEVLDLAAAVGQPNQRPLPRAEVLVIDAHSGVPDIAARADEIDAELRRHPTGVLDVLTLHLLDWSRGIAAAREAPEAAIGHLSNLTLPLLRRAAALDLLDVAGRVERNDLAERLVHDLDEFASPTGNDWAHGIAAHGRALLAPADQRESHFLDALRHHARPGGRPLDRARAELAYGEFLRRARRRVDAREHLRSAIATFDHLGATAWTERAVEELRASGETARRRAAEEEQQATTVLTAQELQVARLVKSGLSNREVAARLFVSPRTVEFHLRNVFAKLGISSRGGLARTDLEAGGREEPPA
jgi:DNA-binding CsgD family transcriptional regulator